MVAGLNLLIVHYENVINEFMVEFCGLQPLDTLSPLDLPWYMVEK